MNAALETRSASRGPGLLLARCTAVNGTRVRTPVVDRLEEQLGVELTRFLLHALAGDHRMRSRGLPG
jgi:hypothetical protein